MHLPTRTSLGRTGTAALAAVMLAGVLGAQASQAAPSRDLDQVAAQVRDLEMQAGAAHERAEQAKDRLAGHPGEAGHRHQPPRARTQRDAGHAEHASTTSPEATPTPVRRHGSDPPGAACGGPGGVPGTGRRLDGPARAVPDRPTAPDPDGPSAPRADGGGDLRQGGESGNRPPMRRWAGGRGGCLRPVQSAKDSSSPTLKEEERQRLAELRPPEAPAGDRGGSTRRRDR